MAFISASILAFSSSSARIRASSNSASILALSSSSSARILASSASFASCNARCSSSIFFCFCLATSSSIFLNFALTSSAFFISALISASLGPSSALSYTPPFLFAMDFFTPFANLPASGTSGTFTDFVFAATVSFTSSTLVGTFGTSIFRFASDFLIPSASFARNGFASSTTFSNFGTSISGSSGINSFGSLEIKSFTSSASGKSGNDIFLLFNDFSTPLVKSSAVGICTPSWEIFLYVLNARRSHFVFLPLFGFSPRGSSSLSSEAAAEATTTASRRRPIAFFLSLLSPGERMPLFPRRCRRRRCERVVLPTNDEEALALVAIVAILYLSLSLVYSNAAHEVGKLYLCLCLYAQLPMIVLDTCIIKRWVKMRKREHREQSI